MFLKLRNYFGPVSYHQVTPFGIYYINFLKFYHYLVTRTTGEHYIF